jgi:sugar/nucleoside kinase (ribokinase family)
MTRLLHLGNVVADLVLNVPSLPKRGADVLAAASRVSAGGGFNVLAAAARQGLAAAYAGAHGRGPFADLARAALADEGIEVLLPPRAGPDTGVVIAIVDDEGERTFLTAPGAEATLTAADLAAVAPAPGDAVYLSGYSFVHPANRAALLAWLPRLDGRSPLPEAGTADGGGASGQAGVSGGAGVSGQAGVSGGAEPAGGGGAAVGRSRPGATFVVFDPGPLVGQIPAGALAAVLTRTDWLTCNAREAAILSGAPGPADAAQVLAARQHGRGVIVRTGPGGCLLSYGGGEPVTVPGFAVRAVDANGAGDAHAGVFIAALASGAAPPEAARRANAAAALAVTRAGPATAPAAAELQDFLNQRG